MGLFEQLADGLEECMDRFLDREDLRETIHFLAKYPDLQEKLQQLMQQERDRLQADKA
jgi:2-oxo-4-hydroxy-4-carboxy--5-ureidoimidazoline (OHCU) decarboxylase